MAATQADVAALAGVARRTVSNVVNDFPYVSEDVRRRVKAAIDELGYQPNRSARSLRIGRTDTIGVALPELDVGYFAEIGRFLVEVAEEFGYTVLISQTLGTKDREVQTLEKFRSQQVAGVIFSAISIEAAELVKSPGDVPVVLLGEHLLESPLDRVTIDNVAATKAAVEHLIDIGRSRVAFVGLNGYGSQPEMPDLRLRGYAEALAAAGIVRDKALEAPVTGFHRTGGFQATQQLLASGVEFDALFGANDSLALGAIRALMDRGRRVPEDVAVAGFDDVDEARFAVPRLTTVSPDKHRIARAAISLLAARIEGGDRPEPFPTNGFTLQIRGSTVGERNTT
jgi:DNA-binding LacI/PurR family transcriptional regulator